MSLLPLLGPTRQQDHERFAVTTKINPVAWPEVDPKFENSRADALCIRQIARRHARQGTGDFESGNFVEVFHPIGERRLAIFIHIIADLSHGQW